MSAIEYKENQDFAIKIDNSNFFWGFSKHKNIKQLKVSKKKTRQDSQNLEISHRGKRILSFINNILFIKEENSRE